MLTQFLIGLAIAVAYFSATWAISVRVKNYGFLDVAWSYGVAILAPLYAWCGPASAERKWPVVIVGVIWSLRLGTYILLRVLKHHPVEDTRYETLRKRWPGTGMFYLFFQMQAVLVAIFSLPFLIIAWNPAPALSTLEIAGLALAFVSQTASLRVSKRTQPIVAASVRPDSGHIRATRITSSRASSGGHFSSPRSALPTAG
jgi:steroid 5-alpha reductase family enzyme